MLLTRVTNFDKILLHFLFPLVCIIIRLYNSLHVRRGYSNGASSSSSSSSLNGGGGFAVDRSSCKYIGRPETLSNGAHQFEGKIANVTR